MRMSMARTSSQSPALLGSGLTHDCRSAFDIAWLLFLLLFGSFFLLFFSVFTDKDALDSRDLTTLHKAVLQISSAKVDDELEAESLEVDEQDVNGRSALWWAAARGDTEAMRALLRRGASVDLSDCEGDSPLHAAFYSPAREGAVRLLLEPGVCFGYRNKRNCTTLHHAVHHHNDAEYIRPLIGPDVTVNKRAGPFGETALAIAARKNHFAVAQQLLDLGADVDLANSQGTTPLMECIYFNCHRTMRLLLGRGAATTARNKQRKTVLHFAGTYSNNETLRLLTEHKATHHTNLTTPSMAGLSPMDLLTQKQWAADAERQAFVELLFTNATARAALTDLLRGGRPGDQGGG